MSHLWLLNSRIHFILPVRSSRALTYSIYSCWVSCDVQRTQNLCFHCLAELYLFFCLERWLHWAIKPQRGETEQNGAQEQCKPWAWQIYIELNTWSRNSHRPPHKPKVSRTAATSLYWKSSCPVECKLCYSPNLDYGFGFVAITHVNLKEVALKFLWSFLQTRSHLGRVIDRTPGNIHCPKRELDCPILAEFRKSVMTRQ